jgi:hypothetical protein
MSEALHKAQAKHREELRKRRYNERYDALDFLINGDLNERHTKKCVHALAGRDACSRDYYAVPYSDAVPDPNDYAGTGIGALYGFEDTERFLWQLAGWNIKRRREYP